jgi:hypothetical protein
MISENEITDIVKIMVTMDFYEFMAKILRHTSTAFSASTVKGLF